MVYNVVFVSAIQPCESAISVHESSPFWASLQPSVLSHFSRLLQSTGLNSLLYSNFLLAICFRFHINSHSYNSLFLLLHSIYDWMFNCFANHSLTNGHTGYFQFFCLCVSEHMSKYFYGTEMELLVKGYVLVSLMDTAKWPSENTTQ